MQKEQGVLAAPPRAASGSFPLCLCVAVPEPGAAPGTQAQGCEGCPGAAARTRCALVTAPVCAPACRQHQKDSAWRSFPPQLLEVTRKMIWGDAGTPKTFSMALGGHFQGITGQAGATGESDAS